MSFTVHFFVKTCKGFCFVCFLPERYWVIGYRHFKFYLVLPPCSLKWLNRYKFPLALYKNFFPNTYYHNFKPFVDSISLEVTFSWLLKKKWAYFIMLNGNSESLFFGCPVHILGLFLPITFCFLNWSYRCSLYNVILILHLLYFLQISFSSSFS